MNLQRQKGEMTGSLSVGIFFGYLPKTPQLTGAAHGKPVAVYIGGRLAFVGTLDKREGKGDRKKKDGGGSTRRGGHSKGVHNSIGTGHQAGGGPGIATHIGPDQYTITLSARGMTKGLMDSSHKHKTGTILGAKTRNAVETLVKPFKVALDWRAPVFDMDKIRFRDGAAVQREVDRVCDEYGYWRYETRDGKLRVTDQAGPEFGEPLILGDNILSFDAMQSEEQANDEIVVKGQRTRKDMWGKDAIVSRVKRFSDSWVRSKPRPVTIQHFTDATDEALERRACYEINKRSAASKDIKIETFHVMQRSGAPWDIGMLHYVEVPTEGIFDVFECTGLSFTVAPDKTLKTQLTLNPPPAGCAQAVGGAFSDAVAMGAARRAMAGITQSDDGSYPQRWSSPDITESQEEDEEDETTLSETPAETPPDFLPPSSRDR